MKQQTRFGPAARSRLLHHVPRDARERSRSRDGKRIAKRGSACRLKQAHLVIGRIGDAVDLAGHGDSRGSREQGRCRNVISHFP